MALLELLLHQPTPSGAHRLSVGGCHRQEVRQRVGQGQAGGQGLLAVALGTLSAVFSSLVIFIEAIAAAFFGWLLFSESMGPLQLAGAGLILGGIWLARPSQ